MMHQTQVHRIEQQLARSDTSGEALMKKFRSASRADVKLACALRAGRNGTAPKF